MSKLSELENMTPMQSVEFQWTIESLRELVKNLNLEKSDYDIDIMEKKVYIRSSGLILSPGNHYVCPVIADD